MKMAVIPARGGSKRIPRKNIRNFCGQPMIAYAINTAKESGLFERIVVSTEDEEIRTVSLAYGAEVPFSRPKELADDHTATVPVIKHAITACQAIGWNADIVCCIYPAVPLLQPTDLSRALDLLLENPKAQYSFPITEFPSAVQRALASDERGHVSSIYKEFQLTRTQDLTRAFYDTGQFYWGYSSAWLSGLSPHNNAVGSITSRWKAVDIDTEDDWLQACLLYETIKRMQS